MAEMLKGLFGGPKSSASTAKADDDFADFAAADYATPSPTPVSHAAPSAADSSPIPAMPTGFAARPYTKWYRVWERTQVSDFYQEMFIIPVLLLIVAIHLWGTRSNKRRARGWMNAHGPILQQEFASVGFGGDIDPITVDDVQSQGLLKSQLAKEGELPNPEVLLKEKAANEYSTYATGRQNVAFVDIKITLLKRYNPLARFGEALLGFFFESMPAPEERMEATAYAFDGRESQLVPSKTMGDGKPPKSDYDGFVWAIVHKDVMKRLRNDRYDLSLTTTRDHAKLPGWATIMTENAEITEALLTPELIRAVEQAGEALDGLIVSDQPIDHPKKLNETVPKKRVSLAMRLPSGSSASSYEPTIPLFQYFLRMTDQMVKDAHFRPEVMKRVRATRDEEIRKIKKLDEDERREEYKASEDKRKKEERDRKLKGMTAEEQRKFLDKEREREGKKAQKKRTMRA